MNCALLPISDLGGALDILSESLPEELIDLLDWFRDFYVVRKNCSLQGRRSARFSAAMWNLYECILINKYHINNHSEATYR
jgi:TolB-like protein